MMNQLIFSEYKNRFGNQEKVFSFNDLRHDKSE
jgi:hypothetical protein